MYCESSFFNECFLSANGILDTMGDTEKNYLLTFILIRLQISEVWFVEMSFSVWGTLNMMGIPMESGSDFDFKQKNAPKCS